MIQRQDESQEWQTPPEFLAMVRTVFGGRIGLDPCTAPSNPTVAQVFYTPADDGLKASWLGCGPIFMNPPYGREIGVWTLRLLHHVGQGEEALALLPARSDTRWFARLVGSADGACDAACFLRGRIRFVDPATGSPRSSGKTVSGKFPSVVLYWGSNASRFRNVFAPHGWVIGAKAGGMR